MFKDDHNCTASMSSTTTLSTTACAPQSLHALKSSQSTRKKRPMRRIIRPEPGSLYDIMGEHCGTALYVLPICWTDLHARLLGAQFVALDPILAPTPVSMNLSASSPTRRSIHVRPSQTVAALSRELTTLLSPEATRQFCKYRAIKTILSTFYPATLSKPRSSADLDLYFGGRVFRKAVRVPVLWKHADQVDASFDSAITHPASSFEDCSGTTILPPKGCSTKIPGYSQSSFKSSQSPADKPMLAYINRGQLSFIRRHLFRIAPGPEGGDRLNIPVSRLQELRSKILFPADADHDAHIVGILLAMAQAHFHGQSASRAPSQLPREDSWRATAPDFGDVQVRLLTHADDTAEFIVYTATVSAAFLQRFSEPSKAPNPSDVAGAGIKIEYAKVPIWPVLGLKERLGQALGQDIAGDAFQNDGTIDEHRDPGKSEDSSQSEMPWMRMPDASRGVKRKMDEQRERVVKIFADVDGAAGSREDDSGEGVVVRAGSLSPAAKRRCEGAAVRSLEVC